MHTFAVVHERNVESDEYTSADRATARSASCDEKVATARGLFDATVKAPDVAEMPPELATM